MQIADLSRKYAVLEAVEVKLFFYFGIKNFFKALFFLFFTLNHLSTSLLFYFELGFLISFPTWNSKEFFLLV